MAPHTPSNDGGAIVDEVLKEGGQHQENIKENVASAQETKVSYLDGDDVPL